MPITPFAKYQCMDKIRILTMSIIVFCGLVPDAWGQFYQYTDKNGNVVITDQPPAGANAKEKQFKDDGVFWSNVSEADYSTQKDGGKTAPVQEERRKDYSRVTAIMYMTDWCGYCRQAKQYIRSIGASLIEYNIDNDADKKAEMKKKSGGSSNIPLIDIDGTIIRGFNKPAIKAALDKSATR